MKTVKRRNTLMPALLAGLLLAFAGVTTVDELPIGSKAPLIDREMTDVSGETYALEALAGEHGLLVIFSCNTCPWVAAWEDRYNPLHARAEELGIGMAVLNPNAALRHGDESLDAMAKRAEASGYTFPYLVDEDAAVAAAFGASRTPHVFLFDAGMKLVYRGAIDDNARNPGQVRHAYLADAMAATAAGTPVDPNTTRSLGCTIKWP